MTHASSEEVARRFVAALHALERDGDAQLEPMLALFAESATLTNAALKHAGAVREGREGARRFWTDYAGLFRGASTKFHQVTVGESAVGLFWTTRAAAAAGSESRLDYDGATLLELDGSDEGRIVRFCGYYDTRALTV